MSNKLTKKQPAVTRPDYIEYDYSLRFTAIRLWIIHLILLLVMLLFGYLAAKAGSGILRVLATVCGGAATVLLFRGVWNCLLSHVGNELYRMKKRWLNVVKNLLYLMGGSLAIYATFRAGADRTELSAIFLLLFLIAVEGSVALKGLFALISHAIDAFLNQRGNVKQ